MGNLLLVSDKALERFDWYFYDTKARVCQAHGKDVLFTQIPQQYLGNDAKKILALTGTDITTHSINPKIKLNNTKLESALPNLLEEELLCESDELIFKLAHPAKSNERYAVVIARDILDSINIKFAAHKITPDFVVPFSMLLPLQREGCSLVEHDDLLYMNCVGKSDLILSKMHFEQIADVFLQQNKPKKIIAYVNDESLIGNIKRICQSHNFDCDIQVHPATLPKVPLDLNLINQVNLTKKQRQKQGAKKTIKIHLAILISLFLVITFGFKFKQIQTLNAQLNQKIAINERIYQEIYPNSTTMIDPRIRMQSDLKRFKAAPKDSFIRILSELEKVAIDKQNITISAFNFQNKVLTLDVSSNDNNQIDKLIQMINSKRLNATIKSMTKKDSKIVASIAIEEV